jgi:hypothetical protein
MVEHVVGELVNGAFLRRRVPRQLGELSTDASVNDLTHALVFGKKHIHRRVVLLLDFGLELG